MFLWEMLTKTKTSNEPLIEWLEKKGFTAQANSLRNGATTLTLFFKQIGDVGAKDIAELLKTNTSLTQPYLGGNQIGDTGAKEIASVLKTNSTLTTLDLSVNQIGDTGANEIALGLKTNSTLTTLNLYDNQIGDTGANEIASVLKTNSTLTTLDLGSNQIGDTGANEIASVLKTNSTLTTLSLYGNKVGYTGAKIGDTGAKEIAAMLKTNFTLASLELGYNQISDTENKNINEYFNRNRKLVETKAETLNTQGDSFCGKGEYDKAIEKYNEAIVISKGLLYVTKYVTNKTNAEKKYEEQQQSLKLKKTTSVVSENKPVDIKELTQENIKEELAIFQKIVVETTAKLENNTAISATDKKVMQNSINEITRTVQALTNKADINTMIKSMEELLSSKITKARIAVVEEDLIEIIEQQVKLDESIRTEKLAIFQKVVEDITTKLGSNTTITEKDKDIMQNSIKGIVSKVQALANKTDIETITESTKEIVSSRITKARLGVIEEEVDQLIEQQSKPSHDVIVNKVEEIIYDNPLLNHPKLLQAAVDSKLSSDLIHDAINNNDEELILAGLISVGYDVGAIN